jgi:hypothetical protein
MGVARFLSIIALAWLLPGLAPTRAQTPAAPGAKAPPAKTQPRPYKPAAVTLPKPSKDASFNAFR